MDDYLPELMAQGVSLITIGKGNRAPHAAAAFGDYGGFYIPACRTDRNVCPIHQLS
jgi:tartrate dehydratase beta subunit/fumarate hydratase class I family protein